MSGVGKQAGSFSFGNKPLIPACGRKSAKPMPPTQSHGQRNERQKAAGRAGVAVNALCTLQSIDTVFSILLPSVSATWRCVAALAFTQVAGTAWVDHLLFLECKGEEKRLSLSLSLNYPSAGKGFHSLFRMTNRTLPDRANTNQC